MSSTPPATQEKPLRRDAARNRELLLDAAEQVFSEGGLEACVEEVARRAGVGMGTLYRRFPTKDALVAELSAHLLERLRLAAEATLKGCPGATRVETFLLAAGEQFLHHAGLLRRLWAAPAPQHDVDGFRSVLAELVTRDRDEGLLREGVAGSDLSVALWGLQGVVETAGPDPALATAAWHRHVALLLDGMLSVPRTFDAPALGTAALAATACRVTASPQHEATPGDR